MIQQQRRQCGAIIPGLTKNYRGPFDNLGVLESLLDFDIPLKLQPRPKVKLRVDFSPDHVSILTKYYRSRVHRKYVWSESNDQCEVLEFLLQDSEIST